MQRVIQKILRHLGLPAEPPVPASARAPTWATEWLPGFDRASDPASV